MELNPEYVKAQLQRRKAERQLAAVARGSGLTRRTIDYILNGRSGHIKTITTLQKYLERTEGQKKLDEPSPDKT